MKHLMATCLGLGLLVSVAAGQTTPTTRSIPATQAVSSDRSTISVAILDFAATNAAAKDFGEMISETMTIMLSGESGFRLVDRTSISKVLQEQQLNLTGLVETDQAVRVGKLIGAKIIIVGRAFELDDSVYITAKMIGTETTLVDGVLVKGSSKGATDALLMELSTKVGERLRARGASLVAAPDSPDPLAVLKQALAGRQLPTVAVVIPEQHLAPRPPAPDPAAQTEIMTMLRECGVKVKDVKGEAVQEWVRTRNQTPQAPMPAELRDVDLLITGEAFSENAAQLGNLRSASARLELSAINPRTGEVVVADRQTLRAVDLSENIAAKTALQKVGRASGLKILQHLSATAQ